MHSAAPTVVCAWRKMIRKPLRFGKSRLQDLSMRSRKAEVLLAPMQHRNHSRIDRYLSYRRMFRHNALFNNELRSLLTGFVFPEIVTPVPSSALPRHRQ